MKRVLLLTVAAAALAGVLAGVARADGALVLRLGPEAGCQLGPTDIPGVPVTIPADCLVVATPSGNATILVRARIPAGFELAETYFGADVPCGFPGLGFGGGVVVATRSGQISATCHVQAGSSQLAALRALQYA